MMIIDTNQDTKLIATLERIRAQEESARCIRFAMGNNASSAGLQEKVVAAALKYITSEEAQIYLCQDGDIYVLARMINTKEGGEFIAEIAGHVGKQADRSWVDFIELPLNVNRVLVEVEAKMEKRRQAEGAKRALLEQQQQERKRQAILNSGSASSREEIKNRRAARKTPEMMIIEDDAFSRRLVENVLQKKYSLTGLGEATYALDTYARLAPDLLFLDINLPDVTGHELLEKIIALDPDAYVIMLSGNCDRENITQAMSKGAKGFVAKPFTKDKLFQYIERCPTIQHV